MPHAADARLVCPACPDARLRPYQTRHICDGCEGMLLTLADLTLAIAEHTGVDPTFAFTDEHAGARTCPKCPATMTTCKLVVALSTEVAKLRPKLDRCAEHGLWFDRDELATVFEKTYAAVGGRPGGGGAGAGGRPSMASGGWRGNRGNPEWWGGGGGGSY